MNRLMEEILLCKLPCVTAEFSHNPILKINELVAKPRCRYNPGFKCSQTPIHKYYGNTVWVKQLFISPVHFHDL